MDANSTIVLARSVGDDEMLQILKSALLHHTLVVGQSGSGKSFFVARLIEEILLRTGARVLLVDPNGDYRSFRKPIDRPSWQHFEKLFSFYSNKARRLAKVADYDNYDKFCHAWTQIGHLTLVASDKDIPEEHDGQDLRQLGLKINWADLAEDEKSAALEQLSMSFGAFQLYQNIRDKIDGQQTISQNLRLIEGILQGNSQIRNENAEIAIAIHEQRATCFELVHKLNDFIRRHRALWLEPHKDAEDHWVVKPSALDFVQYPFHPLVTRHRKVWRDLSLVLDSVDTQDMLFAVDAILGRVWRSAKAATIANLESRAPIFLVIDEAQNFIPKEPRRGLQERVADRIYQIASEGRKYGLYLILVSQRPSKLHPGVVPECENSAILRLQSPDEINFARDKLGTDVSLTAQIPKFTKGRAVVHGQWSPEARDVTIAPARTVLGGRGIDPRWLKGQFDPVD
jgi:DNA helicase HerA-like ATPase